MNLDKIKKVYFIGIGGIGISALAKMMKHRGMEVSGVNDDESPQTLDPLREIGVEVMLKKDYAELPEADLYVYSDAWLYRGPEILESAKATGKRVLSYFEALGEISKKYKTIAISGTHGKTTTTAMVAEVLIDAGLDPTVLVGSFVKKFGSNFRAGEGEYLVVEADEFNRHMLFFNPFIGAVTNVEADHLDVYKDLDDIKNAFDKFLSQSEHKITEAEYQKYIEKVPKLKVPGEHNRQNAGVALAVADVLGIDESKAQQSLANFTGTWRRLEKRGEVDGVIVYDDYAHHPTEVKASLQALKGEYPGQKIIVVFQPHMYSRTRALWDEFTKCFSDADEVYLLPIFYAREDPDPEISSERLAQEIAKAGKKVQSFPDFKSAYRYFKDNKPQKGDIFLTQGAGEAYKVADDVFGLK